MAATLRATKTAQAYGNGIVCVEFLLLLLLFVGRRVSEIWSVFADCAGVALCFFVCAYWFSEYHYGYKRFGWKDEQMAAQVTARQDR